MNKEKHNQWKRATIILGSLLIILIVYNIYTIPEYIKYIDEPNLTKEMCSKINATPSWMDGNANLIGTGVQPFANDSSIVVNTLINQSIYFLYNPNCGACENQIEFFGEDWNRYLESGYAIDCNKILNSKK